MAKKSGKNSVIKTAVIGATGYTGVELIKILLRHPFAEITALTTRQDEAIPVHRLIPDLPPSVHLEIKQHDLNKLKKQTDVVFLCLPHTEAMDTGAFFLKAGKIVIDLSADFRLKQTDVYEKWYQVKHTAKDLNQQAVYGLPEFFKSAIRNADLIANPGCYPTGSALGIAPLLKCGVVEKDSIIIDAKSGVSGGGKKLVQAFQYCEANENFNAYKVFKHQHTPEIEQTLSAVAGEPIRIIFTPHLLPLHRGILSTIYLKLKKGMTGKEIEKAFRDTYQKAPFVRFKGQGQFPALKDVQKTNYCDIGFDVQGRDLIVITAIDNLIKGASGQAVQNMNIRCDFEETTGLLTW